MHAPYAWSDMVHGCMVYTEHTEMAAVSCGTSHVSTAGTTCCQDFHNLRVRMACTCVAKLVQKGQRLQPVVRFHTVWECRVCVAAFVHKGQRLITTCCQVLYSLRVANMCVAVFVHNGQRLQPVVSFLYRMRLSIRDRDSNLLSGFF